MVIKAEKVFELGAFKLLANHCNSAENRNPATPTNTTITALWVKGTLTK